MIKDDQLKKIINFDLRKHSFFLKPSVIALGKFETIHCGHQEILSRAYEISKTNNLDLIIMLYPDFDGFKNEFKKQVFPFGTRLDLLEQYNPTHFLVFEPNIKNYSITFEQFSMYLKQYLNTKQIVIGENFKIKEIGDFINFQKDFKLDVIPLKKINNQIISSTTIRTMLLNGEVKSIKDLLGFNYFYSGKVISGNQIGRKLNFPTANVEVDENLLYPKKGVYLSLITIEGKKHYSLTSISTRPTFSDSDLVFFETYVLDFDEIIYGKKVYVELIDYIRDVKKFHSTKELVDEIQNDIKKAREIINNLIK